MQALPTITYYTIYYRRKTQFLSDQKPDVPTTGQTDLLDPLFDDVASRINMSRTDSRASVFSRTLSYQNLD